MATKETELLRSFCGDRKTIVRLEFTTGSSFPQGPLGIDLVGSAPLGTGGWGCDCGNFHCELRESRLWGGLAPSLFPAEFKPAGRGWDTRVSVYHTLTQESLRSHRWTTSVVAKCCLWWFCNYFCRNFPACDSNCNTSRNQYRTQVFQGTLCDIIVKAAIFNNGD